MIKLFIVIAALCAPILCELDDQQQSAHRQIKLEDIERDNLVSEQRAKLSNNDGLVTRQHSNDVQQQGGQDDGDVRYVTGAPNQYQATPPPYTPVHEADRTHSAPSRYSLLSSAGGAGGEGGHSTPQPPLARYISQPQPQYVYVQAGGEQAAVEPQQQLLQYYPSFAQQAHLQPQFNYAQQQAYVMVPFLHQQPALQAQPVHVPQIAQQPGYLQPNFLPSATPTPYTPGYSGIGGPSSVRPDVVSFSRDHDVPNVQSSTQSPNKYYKNVQFIQSSTPSSIQPQQYPQQQYPQQQYPQQQYPQQQYPQQQYPQQQYPQQQYPQQQYPQDTYPQQSFGGVGGVQYAQQYPSQAYPSQATNVQPLHTSISGFGYNNQIDGSVSKSVAPLDYPGIQSVQQSYPSYQTPAAYDFYGHNNRHPTSLLDSYIPSSVLFRQNPQYSQRYPGGGFSSAYDSRHGQSSQIDQSGGYNTIAYSAPLYPSAGVHIKRSSATQTATPTVAAPKPIKKA